MLLNYKIHESCSSVEYDMIIESCFFIFYLKLEIWLKEDVTEVHELQVSTLTPFSFVMPYVYAQNISMLGNTARSTFLWFCNVFFMAR